jgi:hypothetical protein
MFCYSVMLYDATRTTGLIPLCRSKNIQLNRWETVNSKCDPSPQFGLMEQHFKCFFLFLHWIKVQTQSYNMVYRTLQLRNNGKVILLCRLINV